MSPDLLRRLTVALMTSAVVLAGCSLSSQKPGLITPAGAARVVRTWWAANETANQSSDPKVWTSLESGLQEQVDERATASRAALKGPTPQRRPISNVRIYVGRQSSYPIFFTASVQTALLDATGRITSTPDIELLDFSRPTSSDRWKLINGVGLGTNPLPQFQLDSDGYVVAPSGVSAPLIKPARISPEWAAYVNNVIQSRPAAETFAPGLMTTTLASIYKDLAAGRPGQSIHVEFYPESGYQSQTMSDGSLLVFFTATFDERHSAVSGVCLIQDAGRRQWGGPVDPGGYSVIDFEGAVFGLAVIPPRGGKAKVKVYGFTGTYLVNDAPIPCRP
jgi:hypothetical protein